MSDKPKQEFLFDDQAWRKADAPKPPPTSGASSAVPAKPPAPPSGKPRREKPDKSAPAAPAADIQAAPDPATEDAPAPPPQPSAAAETNGDAADHNPMRDGSGPLRGMMDRNFLEYASYVICDRAIPSLEDGLKPVQRRILYSLHERDDGRFTKVANVVGHTMQYHPHGDASIGDALVNLTNKRYLIEGQGNFGNVLTGDSAAAARYIECRLTELARKEVFNDELTEFVPNYDGRKQEPVTLPAKLPLLLMLGAEGIAVGLSTRILPHNFGELIEAQIAILQKKPFTVYPDFQQGGLMDVSEYDKGLGKVKLRAGIEKASHNRLIVREVPAGTTTESLTASIEDAVRKKKVPIRSINDFTAENVEIELILSQGATQEKAIKALYAFTSCETSLSSRPVVIRRNRPLDTNVDEILRDNTKQLVLLLERELKLKQKHLQDAFHQKTLVQIFVEERIYKRIESCTTYPDIVQAIQDGFEPFKSRVRRPITTEDIEMLLGVRIRRISMFDINKSRQEIDGILKDLAAVEKALKSPTRYAIAYLKQILKTYGPAYPRLTRITTFSNVEVRELTARELRICIDREKGYVGSAVDGELLFECSSLDKLLFVWDDGRYRVIPPPEKRFVDTTLVYCRKAERDKILTLAYTDLDTGFTYMKRFTIGGFVMDREYRCTTDRAKVLLFQDDDPEDLYIKYKPAKNQRIHQQRFKPHDVAVKGAKARGNQMTAKGIARIAAATPRWWNENDDSPKGRLL
jgi:topoisomerase IV subunit A